MYMVPADADFGIQFVWINGELVYANTLEEYDHLVRKLQEQIRRDESRPIIVEDGKGNVTYEPTMTCLIRGPR